MLSRQKCLNVEGRFTTPRRNPSLWSPFVSSHMIHLLYHHAYYIIICILSIFASILQLSAVKHAVQNILYTKRTHTAFFSDLISNNTNKQINNRLTPVLPTFIVMATAPGFPASYCVVFISSGGKSGPLSAYCANRQTRRLFKKSLLSMFKIGFHPKLRILSLVL